MRLISFNVNGIRSVSEKSKTGEKGTPFTKNLLTTLATEQHADVLCLQEIKTQSHEDLLGYKNLFPHIYTNTATSKKGYSGVAILSKHKPLAVYKDFSLFSEYFSEYTPYDFMKEGRILTAEYSSFYLVTVYTPNSKDKLTRLDERLIWDDAFLAYIQLLQGKNPQNIALPSYIPKPIIVCGDLNCANEPIDIHNPSANKYSAGYSDKERSSFKQLLMHAALTDTFRTLNPATVKYSYWSNMGGARKRNAGWRIDYFLVSSELKAFIQHADCLTEYHGSDHCPVIMDMTL
jgi:exodeoxyribonuclease-3